MEVEGVVEEEGTEHAHLGAGRKETGNRKGERMGVGSFRPPLLSLRPCLATRWFAARPFWVLST